MNQSCKFFDFPWWKRQSWQTLPEKQGLHQAADILEKYEIDCDTDVSDLDQDDFSNLESGSRGLISSVVFSVSQTLGYKEDQSLV